MKSLAIAVFLTVLAAAGGAAASPCGAGALPVGSKIRGPVLHVLDGASLCVALSPAPGDWTPVRLVDAPPSSSRSLLMAVAFAEDADCTVVGAEAGSAIAVCSVKGRSIGERAREPEAKTRAKRWR